MFNKIMDFLKNNNFSSYESKKLNYESYIKKEDRREGVLCLDILRGSPIIPITPVDEIDPINLRYKRFINDFRIEIAFFDINLKQGEQVYISTPFFRKHFILKNIVNSNHQYIDFFDFNLSIRTSSASLRKGIYSDHNGNDLRKYEDIKKFIGDVMLRQKDMILNFALCDGK